MNAKAFLSLGFRPFFLLCGLVAVLDIPLWVASMFGWKTTLGVSWHAHEMLYGFALAAIAGFLLTAVRNWTGRETAQGGALLFLCAVWALGRVVMLLAPWLPEWLVALVDLLFVPLLAVAVSRPIIAVRQWRQLVVLVPLCALGLPNLAFHFSVASRRTALLVALDLVLLLVVVIGGRVIPFFTRSALRLELEATPRLDKLALLSMAACAVAELAPPTVFAAILLASAAVQAARLRLWRPAKTLGTPLLWILHSAYAWLSIGLALRALALLTEWWPQNVAVHLLSVGCIGSAILGMMARVSLGHTGRPLVPARAMTVAFALLSAAAVARALAYWSSVGYVLAAIVWSAAFVCFLFCYTPILVSRRIEH